MPATDYYTGEPFPIEWISNIQEKRDDINMSMNYSQRKEKNIKNSGHLSLEKSFDQSLSSSPEKRKKSKTRIVSFQKRKTSQKSAGSSTEITLFNKTKKSKFSFNIENEIFPESTKSINERNILTLEPVEN